MSGYILKSTFVLASLAPIVFAFPPVVSRDTNCTANNNGSSVDTLSWGSCGDDAPAPFECATFQVPLDWADTQKGNISLAVIRLPAATQPREGYMFYNPGGPGVSGVEFFSESGSALQAQIGQSWDVLSWDPRGIGKSGPNATLFPDATSFEQFWSQTQGLGHLDAHGNLTTPSDVDFFMSRAPEFDDFIYSFNEQYVAKVGDNLKYIGSAAVVRDLVALTDATYGVGVDVNYYAYSYGTVLAAYLTQMFPDRVGKVIIDGVLDSVTYSNDLPMIGFPIDISTAENALQGWASYCVAAPDKCQTASIVQSLLNVTNVTSTDIIAAIDKIMGTAYLTYDGTIWNNGSMPDSPTGWTYDEVAIVIYESLYSASNWKRLDDSIVSLYAMQNNITLPSSDDTTSSKRSLANKRFESPLSHLFRRRSPVGFLPRDFYTSEVTYAIACGDQIDLNTTASNTVTTESVFEQIVQVSQNVSYHFGSNMNPRWLCHKWTSRAVERLPLPMTIKPKNVVLVIGNTADVITPYSSAQKLASEAHLGNMARLVQFNAIGHTTLANNSTCINNVVKSFASGTIPADAGNDGPDVECDIDTNPFNYF